MTIAPEADEILITRTKARELLGMIGETKLWELEKEGEIEVVRIGRRSLVVAESCRAYVRRLRAAAATGELATNTEDPCRLDEAMTQSIRDLAAQHGKTLVVTASDRGLIYQLVDAEEPK